jgi:urea transport system permease protein
MPEPTTPPSGPPSLPPNSSQDTVALAASRARLAFQSSQTFVSRSPDPRVLAVRIVVTAALLILFFVIVPVLSGSGLMPGYKVNQLGRFLSYAIAALGMDLIWGYSGFLSLCQAMFFCMGAYIMAMHLSLAAGGGDVRPEYNNIPQFMFFNNVSTLPWFWKPFSSTTITIVMAVMVPALSSAVLGFFFFRSRVRGVYFSIVTQAIAWGAWLLISRNEMLLGGTNGLTNFYKPYTESNGWILTWYLSAAIALLVCYLFCFFLVRSRLGRVLIAIRDKETRLYFAGYRPYAFKMFAWAVAGALAGIAGILYAPQQGIITPQNMQVLESIMFAIFVALGGRGRLWGAVLGALVIQYGASATTSDLPKYWPFVLGAIFVIVPLFLPDGLVGLWSSFERQLASGAPFVNLFFTVLPLLSLAAFVLAEALGMEPAIMQHPLDGVPIKYITLLALLVASAVYYAYLKYSERMATARQPIAVPGAEVA